MFVWQPPCVMPGSFRVRRSADMPSRNALIPKDLTLKLALGWVGSAAAFNWPVIIWVALWPLITGATGGQVPGAELPINIHLYDLMIGFIPAVWLIFFRYGFKANRPAEFSGSTIKNLLAQALAAIAGVMLSLALVSIVGTVPLSHLAGAPIGVASSWGQIFGFTVITIAIAEFRAATKRLARKTHRLAFLKTNLEQRVLEQRNTLRLQVEDQLSEQVNLLHLQLNGLKSASDQDERAALLAARIGDTIDDFVRPLSRELANSVNEDTRAEVRTLRQVERQISRLPLAQRMGLAVNLRAVFNATFGAIFLLVFIVPTYGYLFGALAMVQIAVPATALSYLVVAIARRLTSSVTSTYGVALVALVAMAAVGALPFAALNLVLLKNQESGLLDFAAFGVFLVLVLVFYGSLFYQAAYPILDRVRAANFELRKLVAFLENEFQLNRRKLAQVVHGKIQARLQAASIRLKQADSVTDELIAAIQDDLQATVLDNADTSVNSQDVQLLLTEIASQWEGICDLTFTLEGQASELVNANSALKAAVVEVVREAVINAVKHGEADEADVLIGLNSPRAVTIKFRNAVYSKNTSSTEQRTGYGSQLFDQLTDSWSIKFEDDDALFEATISIAGANL